MEEWKNEVRKMWDAYDRNDRKAELSHLKGAEQALRSHYEYSIGIEAEMAGIGVSELSRVFDLWREEFEIRDSLEKGEKYMEVTEEPIKLKKAAKRMLFLRERFEEVIDEYNAIVRREK